MAEAFEKGQGVVVKIHKDEIGPPFDAYGPEREIDGPEAGLPFELGGGNQRPVEVVGPAVIAATEELARAAAFGGRSSAVAADVIEAAKFALESASDQERLTAQVGGKEVAGINDLVGVSDDLPGTGENTILFEVGDIRIDIILCRNGPGDGYVGVDFEGSGHSRAEVIVRHKLIEAENARETFRRKK